VAVNKGLETFERPSPPGPPRSEARDAHRSKSPTLGAYRLVTLDGVIRRWDADLPTANPSVYREDGIAALVFETLAALDPHSSSRLPPAFRCPNGPLADIARICQGQPLYDPAKLTMPTLLVRGDDDTTSTHSAAVRLLGEIASPRKRYCVVAPGSHFLCIERNRAKLYAHLNDFFAPIRPSATSWQPAADVLHQLLLNAI